MPNIFKEVRILRQEGKLHSKLTKSLRMQSIISGVLAAVAIFNVLFRGASPLIAIVLAIIGFILGLIVFSRMNAVVWNEEEETVTSQKMDKIGYVVICLYVIFEISLRTFLHNTFPATATALLLSGIFGTLLGRVIASIIKIHRVYKNSH